MRDDLFPLTRAERRAAVAGWRRTPLRARREACRLADEGLPATDPTVSAAARLWGEFLLQKNRSNRMPRSSLPALGLLLVVLGLLMDAPDPWVSAAKIAVVAGGVVVMAGGALSWGQRRAGRVLVAANPPVTAPGRVAP